MARFSGRQKPDESAPRNSYSDTRRDCVCVCFPARQPDIRAMCHVSRLAGEQQFIHQDLQHWRAGAVGAAGLALLHNFRDRDSSSPVRLRSAGIFVRRRAQLAERFK